MDNGEMSIDGSCMAFENEDGGVRSCPYNPNHKCSRARFGIHLEKCRMGYVDKKLKEGFAPLRLSCKYNPAHQILAPELMLHEQSCDEEYRATVDYLFAAVYDEVKEMEKNKVSSKIENENSLENVWDEIPQQFAEDPNFEKIIKSVHEKFQEDATDIRKKQGNPELSVFWADPEQFQRSRKDSTPVVFQTFESDLSVVCRRRQAIRHRRAPRDPTPYPSSGGKLEGNIDKDDDDEEDWSTGDGSVFSWYENQMKIHPLSFRHPPSLSKSQRKQFAKVASDKLLYEHGIFSEEEPTAEFQEHVDNPQVFHIDAEELYQN